MVDRDDIGTIFPFPILRTRKIGFRVSLCLQVCVMSDTGNLASLYVVYWSTMVSMQCLTCRMFSIRLKCSRAFPGFWDVKVGV